MYPIPQCDFPVSDSSPFSLRRSENDKHKFLEPELSIRLVLFSTLLTPAYDPSFYPLLVSCCCQQRSEGDLDQEFKSKARRESKNTRLRFLFSHTHSSSFSCISASHSTKCSMMSNDPHLHFFFHSFSSKRTFVSLTLEHQSLFN